MTKLSLEQIEANIEYWEYVRYRSDYADSFEQANAETREANRQIQFYQTLKEDLLRHAQ